MEKPHPIPYEHPKLPIYYLPERLCFIETPELQDLRAELVPAMAEGRPGWIDLKIAYIELCERMVDAHKGDEATYMRLGATILVATLQRDSGRIIEYLEEVESVLDDVEGLIRGGFEELNVLADILAEELHDEHARQS